MLTPIMNKKLSKPDYLMTLLFLFVIIGALAAFFYGVKIGKEKTTVKYEAILAEKQELSKELTAYHQQYLVSFYHTIYLPYRDFQKLWFNDISKIELEKDTVDPQGIFRELNKLATDKFKDIESMSMPVSSPLLQEAHSNYLKSLKLFAEASDKFRAKSSTIRGAGLIEQMNKDAFFQEAKNFALLAQDHYFASIIQWNESVQADLKGVDLVQKDDLTFNEWTQLNLNLKNLFIAKIMKKKQLLCVLLSP